MTTRLVQNVVQRTTEGFQQMSLGQSDDLLPESFTVLTQDGISLAKVSVIDVSQTYLLWQGFVRNEPLMAAFLRDILIDEINHIPCPSCFPSEYFGQLVLHWLPSSTSEINSKKKQLVLAIQSIFAVQALAIYSDFRRALTDDFRFDFGEQQVVLRSTQFWSMTTLYEHQLAGVRRIVTHILDTWVLPHISVDLTFCLESTRHLRFKKNHFCLYLLTIFSLVFLILSCCRNVRDLLVLAQTCITSTTSRIQWTKSFPRL